MHASIPRAASKPPQVAVISTRHPFGLAHGGVLGIVKRGD